MVKYQSRTIGGIAILLMFGFSPSLFVDFENFLVHYWPGTDLFHQKSMLQIRLLRAILTEKVVNGKLEVLQYSLPEDISKKDMQRMLSFDGETSGWAYVNYKAYQSGNCPF